MYLQSLFHRNGYQYTFIKVFNLYRYCLGLGGLAPNRSAVRKNIKKWIGRRIAGLSASVERRIETAGRTWQRRDYRLAAPHPDGQRSSARSAAAAAAASSSSPPPPLSIRYRSPSTTSPTVYSSRTHTLTQTSTAHRRRSFRIISARW